MRSSAILYTVAAWSALLLFSACGKTPLGSGKEVRFTAESSSSETKVAYSGDYVTDQGRRIERINWVDGDKVTIWSDKARTWKRNGVGSPSCVYNVVDITPAGRYSRAGIEVPFSQNEGGLQWGEGSHLFLGLYPVNLGDQSAGGDPLSVGLTDTGGALPVSFTTAQRHVQDGTCNMGKWAYHFAMKEATKPSGDNKVTLSFEPYFTAFEFRITDGENAGLSLKQLRLLSNKDLAGRDIFTVGTNKQITQVHREIPDNNTDTNIRVTYDNARALSQNTAHVLTVFGGMNPDTDHQMRVELTFTGNDVRTLDLTTRADANSPWNWFPFPRGKTAIIHLNVLSTGISFTITVEGQQIDYYAGSSLDQSGWYE